MGNLSIEKKIRMIIPWLNLQETFQLTIALTPSAITDFMGDMNPSQLALVFVIKSARHSEPIILLADALEDAS